MQIYTYALQERRREQALTPHSAGLLFVQLHTYRPSSIASSRLLLPRHNNDTRLSSPGTTARYTIIPFTLPTTPAFVFDAVMASTGVLN